MFKKFTNACVKLVQRFLPDPFIFCVVLTLVVFALGITLTGQTPLAMVVHWGKGFWSLLAFSMQMALVLVLGHAMANTPAFKRMLSTLACIPKTPGQAIVIVSIVALIACWINWGFGLVIGAIFAKEIARKIKNVDYRLLIASAYSGFLIWHQGVSGSIPLAIASGDEAVRTLTQGVINSPVPTSLTIFHPAILLTSLAFFIFLPLLNRAMHPAPEHTISFVPPEDGIVSDSLDTSKMTPADRAENGPLFSVLTAALGIIYIVHYFVTSGFLLTLNIVNFIFLIVGIILHRTPRSYLNAIADGSRGASGILLQFPFYAGIASMMVGASSNGISVGGMFSTAMVSIANTYTFPFLSFLSAGLVNIFVPSGGGQWAVQAPIILPAAQNLGVHPAVASMAVAFGDAWTNMIQPFWALPALGIAGLGAKDIMGYCVVDLIAAGVIMGVGITLFGVMI